MFPKYVCLIISFDMRHPCFISTSRTRITVLVQASVMYFVTEPCFVTYIKKMVVFIQFDHADSKSDECQLVTVKRFCNGKIHNGRQTNIV